MALLLATAGVAVVSGASPAAAADNGPWHIWAQSNRGLCLQSGLAVKASVTVQPCKNGAYAQEFYFKTSKHGYTWITDAGGLCLNVSGGVYKNSAHIITYECAGGNDEFDSEIWLAGPPDYYMFFAHYSRNFVLNVSGATERAGAPLILYQWATTSSGAVSPNEMFSWSRNV